MVANENGIQNGQNAKAKNVKIRIAVSLLTFSQTKPSQICCIPNNNGTIDNGTYAHFSFIGLDWKNKSIQMKTSPRRTNVPPTPKDAPAQKHMMCHKLVDIAQ